MIKFFELDEFCKLISLRGTLWIVEHSSLEKLVRAWKWKKQKFASEKWSEEDFDKKDVLCRHKKWKEQPNISKH